jgi:Ca2+-binding RTX toxin-like protein
MVRNVGTASNGNLADADGDHAIDGKDGDDRIVANTGNGQLTGGKGGDLLDGGAGIDTAHEGSAQSVSMNQGDMIDLFDAVSNVADPPLSFIGTNGFSAPNQVRFFFEGDHTVVAINTSGNSGAETEIELAGKVNPVSSDFAFDLDWIAARLAGRRRGQRAPKLRPDSLRPSASRAKARGPSSASAAIASRP